MNPWQTRTQQTLVVSLDHLAGGLARRVAKCRAQSMFYAAGKPAG
jgi:hypothetical protein